MLSHENREFYRKEMRTVRWPSGAERLVALLQVALDALDELDPPPEPADEEPCAECAKLREDLRAVDRCFACYGETFDAMRAARQERIRQYAASAARTPILQNCSCLTPTPGRVCWGDPDSGWLGY